MEKQTAWQWIKESNKWLLFPLAFLVLVFSPLGGYYQVPFGLKIFVLIVNIIAWIGTYVSWRKKIR